MKAISEFIFLEHCPFYCLSVISIFYLSFLFCFYFLKKDQTDFNIMFNDNVGMIRSAVTIINVCNYAST